MKKSKKVRKMLRTKQKTAQKKAKLGSGKRFAALEASIAAGGAKNPAAVAAAIGRKKYGAKKMATISAKAKKKKK